jgi:hypothetical protein
MLDAAGKAVLVLGAAFGTSIVVTVEVFAYTLWMFDRDPSCRTGTNNTCAFNFLGAMAVGTVAGLAALVATFIGMFFFVAGRRTEAKIIFGGLVVLLAIGHSWPLF